MKLAVAGLCLLGLIAAACAAFLVSGLQTTGLMPAPVVNKPDDNQDVTVLFVAHGISAMTVVDGSMVTARIMSRKSAPTGYLSNPVEVVGKIVSQTLVAGQPFTKSSFADISGPRQLASVIPKGKRAVAIALTDYGGLEGLLYPGSIVDVMVSFKNAAFGASGDHGAVTTTLLQNVQVLAFDQQSVVTPGKVVNDFDGNARAGGNKRVTLLVDTKQAKALELAMEQGTLSLALRNPLDETDADKGAVSVPSLMGEEPPIGLPVVSTDAAKSWAAALKTAISTFTGGGPRSQPSPVAAPTTRPVESPPSRWDVEIIQGTQQVETRSFPRPVPGSKPDERTSDASGAGAL